MKLFVVVTCWIGIVAAAVDDDKDEIESLGVSEGENLTIAIHIKKTDKDPQVLVTRLKDSSKDSIAQLICHNGDCEREEKSGVSLIHDGENVTLILMNVSNNQTGLYTVCKLSDSLLEKQIYNVTVYQAPLRTISSSVMYSESFTAGITSAGLVLIILVLITGAIGVVFCKRRKVECFKQAVCDFLSILQRKNRNPNQEKDIEAGDGEAGDGEARKFLPSGSMVYKAKRNTT